MDEVNEWKPRLATRLAFLAAGFGAACWAPLVPFAKVRAGVGEGALGLLLLCLGAGSIAAMPLTAVLVTRLGSRPVILGGGTGLAIFLPMLAWASHPFTLGAALFGFGATLGALDVAMNLHAVEVEKAAARPLMSGFHALFSLGGFAGSGFMTLALSNGISPLGSALIAGAVVGAAANGAAPYALRSTGRTHGPLFVMPRGTLLLLALLAYVAFQVEGALLDWSALLLVTSHIVAAARGGVGYMLFSIAMTTGRLTGDRVVARLGERRVFVLGSIVAVAGFVLLLLVRSAPPALGSFVLIGLGAANIVPIILRRAGNERSMPGGIALAAVTTAGYAGLLAGPALVGFIANGIGLRGAFMVLTLLLCLMPALNRTVAKPT